MLLGHPAQKQVLSRVLKHIVKLGSRLFKDPVSQTVKGEDIHIHDDLLRGSGDQLPLCRHGKLLRHDHNKVALRLFFGPAQNLIEQVG